MISHYDATTGDPIPVRTRTEDGEEAGMPVFLARLWQHIARTPALQAGADDSARMPFDYGPLMLPLNMAHQQVKSLLRLVDALAQSPASIAGSGKQAHAPRLSLTPVASVEEAGTTEKRIDRMPLYLRQASEHMRRRAHDLQAQFERDARLTGRAMDLRAQGFAVEFSADLSAWLVDYGHRALFQHFWEHLVPIAQRHTYALLTAVDLRLVFAKSHPRTHMFIWVGDDRLRLLPDLFARASEDVDVRLLDSYRQGCIEGDFFRNCLVPVVMDTFAHARALSADCIAIPSLARIELVEVGREEDSGAPLAPVAKGMLQLVQRYLQSGPKAVTTADIISLLSP